MAFISLQTNSERVTNLHMIALPIPDSISNEKKKDGNVYWNIHLDAIVWKMKVPVSLFLLQ